MLHDSSNSSLPLASRAGRQVLRARGFLGLLMALVGASAGCTIVIGERPDTEPDADTDVDAGGSGQPDRAQDEPDADADTTPAPDSGGSDADGSDASESDASALDAGASDGGDGGSNGELDAALDARVDSATEDASQDSGAPPDTGSEDSGPDCTAAVVWYPDDDGDGFGRTGEPTEACETPPGEWSRTGGDCYDDNKNVYPGQTAYFAQPYPRTGSNESFDYDCSNTEVGNPGQSSLEGGCGGLLGLLCSEASGYSPRSNWTGPGRNPMCGSTILVHCQMQSLTACVAGSPEDAPTPYTCR